MLKVIPFFRVHCCGTQLITKKVKREERVSKRAMDQGTRESINYKGIGTKSTAQATSGREQTPWVETVTEAYLA